MPMTHSTRHVLAAAAACASSRGSIAAKHPDTARRRGRARSRSIHHDNLCNSPKSRAYASWLIGRSSTHASRTHQTPPNHPLRRSASQNNALSQHPNPHPVGQDCRRPSTTTRDRLPGRSQIPIALAASQRQHPATSCLGAFRTPTVTAPGWTAIPASENLHKLGKSQVEHFGSGIAPGPVMA